MGTVRRRRIRCVRCGKLVAWLVPVVGSNGEISNYYRETANKFEDVRSDCYCEKCYAQLKEEQRIAEWNRYFEISQIGKQCYMCLKEKYNDSDIRKFTPEGFEEFIREVLYGRLRLHDEDPMITISMEGSMLQKIYGKILESPMCDRYIKGLNEKGYFYTRRELAFKAAAKYYRKDALSLKRIPE